MACRRRWARPLVPRSWGSVASVRPRSCPDYLKQLAADPRFRDRVVIRQVNQDSDAALVDFHGAATTHAQLARAEKIRLVPVVAFYGPQGKHLAEPIVGARLPDFYPSYLEESVEKSSQALKAR